MKKNKVKSARAKKSGRSKHAHYWRYGLIVLIVLFAALIRYRYLDSPLERDEGEYAYAGQLILQGVPPYQLAYNMKLPGTYAAYALILALFGQTPSAIHVGLLLINAATTLLVYFIATRLFEPNAGLAACATYAFLSLGQAVLGTAGHATHFVLLPALGGFLLLLKATKEHRASTLFWSGLLVGVSFVMKQPGIFYILFALLYYLLIEWQARPIDWRRFAVRGGFMMLGTFMPFGLTCLILWGLGVFGRFWFWTFTYAGQYATRLSVSEGIHNFSTMTSRVVGSSIVIWLIAAVGLVALICHRDLRAQKTFVLGLLVTCFLAICPGLYFREHYFILMLPAVALLVGFVIYCAGEYSPKARWPQNAATLAFMAALCISILQQHSFLFDMNPIAACRASYGANPFPEAREVAGYIRTHSVAADSIAVLGSEPEIYFYSKRRSGTGYIYTYGLMENQRYASQMQKEMINEIEAARPAYLVVVNSDASWLVQPGSDRGIFPWVNQYVRKQYALDGIVDVLNADRTIYLWGNEVRNYQPRSSTNLLVFKRTVP